MIFVGLVLIKYGVAFYGERFFTIAGKFQALVFDGLFRDYCTPEKENIHFFKV